MSTVVSNNVTYVGDIDFDDAHEPVPGKTEWGMDSISRTMRGGQSLLVAFMESLSQGQTYTFNSNVFYLQSWECDNHPVFPSVSMMYKGLVGGIPTPKASGSGCEQTLTITAGDVGTFTNAKRVIRYLSRTSSTLYITTSIPTAASYGLDVDFDPYSFIISSIIYATDAAGNDREYAGEDAPASLVSAMTPVGVYDVAVPKSSPVVGSPFYENEDTCTRLLPGGN